EFPSTFVQLLRGCRMWNDLRIMASDTGDASAARRSSANQFAYSYRGKFGCAVAGMAGWSGGGAEYGVARGSRTPRVELLPGHACGAGLCGGSSFDCGRKPSEFAVSVRSKPNVVSRARDGGASGVARSPVGGIG